METYKIRGWSYFCTAQISTKIKALDLNIHSFKSSESELKNASRIIEKAFNVQKLWHLQNRSKIVKFVKNQFLYRLNGRADRFRSEKVFFNNILNNFAKRRKKK